MSKSDNNIDKFFKDGLGDFSFHPVNCTFDKVLQGIEKVGHENTRLKRNKIIAWIGFSAAILILISYLFFLKSCNVNGSIDNYKFMSRNNLQVGEKGFLKTIYKKQGKHYSQNSFVAINKNDIKFTGLNAKKSIADIEGKDISALNAELIELVDQNKLLNSNFSLEKVAKIEYNNTDNQAFEKINNGDIKTSENTQVSADNTLITNINLDTNGAEILKFESSNSTDSNSLTSLPTLPSTSITTGFLISFGVGTETVLNNLPSSFIFDKPIIVGQNKNAIKTMSSSLLLEYKFSNFIIKSGFGLSEFGENATLNIGTVKHDTSGGYLSWNFNQYYTYDTIGYYDDPLAPGAIFPILSAVSHVDTIGSQWNSKDKIINSIESFNSKNRYRYIEIPLIIAYQYNIKRFGIYAAGGISYGIMINTSGKYVNDNNLRDINFKENPYRKGNFNYIFNFGANYFISNKWNIFTQTNFKANISSIYKPEFDLGTKFQSFGLSIGLSYIIK